MIFGSVCSGIEAASMAWLPLGWDCAFLSEIDPFCCAVLSHHYPETINYGDFTKIKDVPKIDVLVAGTPCQSFSVAGRRAGLDDSRGNLTLGFLRLIRDIRPRWLVWENVPGVLSIDGGWTFGIFLGSLAKLGYGFAYRVLDAQYFGVPQRRRRVFVVGHLGDWRRAAAVLLEREGLCRDTTARCKAREDVAGSLGGGTGERGWCNGLDRSGAFVSMCLNAKGGSGRLDGESETFVAHTLRGDGYDAGEDGTGRCTPLVPIAFSSKDSGADAGPRAPTLRAMPHDQSHANAGGQIAVCVQEGQTGVREYATAGTIRSDAPGTQPGGSLIRQRMAVRRLTPRECERLQGMPDDYTLIPYRGKPAADGPRYRAIGNSMAVPVMRWIGERIQVVDGLTGQETTSTKAGLRALLDRITTGNQ